jgi:pimeloyl-ACP methyl ester carboxylesterase
MTPRPETLTLHDGRAVTLHALSDGPRVIVFCHAAPGSGAFDPDPAQTAERAVRLLAVDRPGYGGSAPPRPGRWATPGDAARDLAEVLDAKGVTSVGVAGWSAGGRVAAGLAALRPDLVSRLVLVATPAPQEAIPWVPEPQQAALEALRGQPPQAVHAALGEQLTPLVPADPAAPGALALLGENPADAPALAYPGARERLTGMLAQAFAQGAAGMAGDIAGYGLQPWGYEPADVTAKTLLLYGQSDPLLTPRHARWWQAKITGARIEMAPRMGHLLIIPMWKRILSFLAPGKA